MITISHAFALVAPFIDYTSHFKRHQIMVTCSHLLFTGVARAVQISLPLGPAPTLDPALAPLEAILCTVPGKYSLPAYPPGHHVLVEIRAHAKACPLSAGRYTIRLTHTRITPI